MNTSFSPERKTSSKSQTISGAISARVQTKADPKSPCGRLSMGYGLLDTEGAKIALKGVHNFVLEGLAPHVSFSGRSTHEPEPNSQILLHLHQRVEGRR